MAKDASMYEVSVAGATLAACRDALRIGALTAAATIVVHPMLYALTEDYSDLFIFVIGTLMVHESLYYLLNSIILLVDAMDWLPYLRIPRKASNPSPPTSLVIKTLKLSALSHWIVQPISLYVLFPLFQHFGCQMSQELPPFTTIVVQIALSVAINDAAFYWTHRLLHLPSLYKRFHKQHHEYKATTGFAAEYASPLEQLLSNQIPVVLGPMLLGMHLSVWFVYLAWRLWRTYEVHSGFDLHGTWLGRIGLFNGYGALYHDFHHTSNRGNYGGPGNAVWDILCGTQDPSYNEYLRKHNIAPYHSWL